MCGRFSQYSLGSAFYELFEIEVVENFHPNRNVFPGQQALMVYQDDSSGKFIASAGLWGFLPEWAKNSKYKRVINARFESLQEKPYFRSAFQYRRCVIPVNGYYEWLEEKNKKTQMYFETRGKEIYLAGLYELTHGRDLNFCIITKEADPGIKGVHDRMPLILDEAHVKKWVLSFESVNLWKKTGVLIQEVSGLEFSPC